MAGWIKLHRKLLESSIFQNSDLLKFWIWCLIKSSHKEHKTRVGINEITLEKGQFIFGRDAAAIELKMKPTTVYKYLKLLEKENKISVKSNNKFSLVTVEKWECYQQDDDEHDNNVTTKEQQRDNNVTTKEQQRDTNKNGKKGENEKNGKNVKNNTPPYPLQEFCFSSDMENKIIEWLTYKTEKKDTYKATGFKTLLGQIKTNSEKYGDQTIIKLINECMANNWKGIIWNKLETKGGIDENVRKDQSKGKSFLELMEENT